MTTPAQGRGRGRGRRMSQQTRWTLPTMPEEGTTSAVNPPPTSRSKGRGFRPGGAEADPGNCPCPMASKEQQDCENRPCPVSNRRQKDCDDCKSDNLKSDNKGNSKPRREQRWKLPPEKKPVNVGFESFLKEVPAPYGKSTKDPEMPFFRGTATQTQDYIEMAVENCQEIVTHRMYSTYFPHCPINYIPQELKFITPRYYPFSQQTIETQTESAESSITEDNDYPVAPFTEKIQSPFSRTTVNQIPTYPPPPPGYIASQTYCPSERGKINRIFGDRGVETTSTHATTNNIVTEPQSWVNNFELPINPLNREYEMDRRRSAPPIRPQESGTQQNIDKSDITNLMSLQFNEKEMREKLGKDLRESAPARGSGVCWNCGIMGHNYSQCPEVKGKFCFGCGKPNARKNSCQNCFNRNKHLDEKKKKKVQNRPEQESRPQQGITYNYYVLPGGTLNIDRDSMPRPRRQD